MSIVTLSQIMQYGPADLFLYCICITMSFTIYGLKAEMHSKKNSQNLHYGFIIYILVIPVVLDIMGKGKA